jgi:hypothetical protein
MTYPARPRTDVLVWYAAVDIDELAATTEGSRVVLKAKRPGLEQFKTPSSRLKII